MRAAIDPGTDTVRVVVGNTVHVLMLRHCAVRGVWFARCTVTGVWHYGFTRESAIRKCREALSER